MHLAELLDIRPGVTALIGGGGKTTLMETLADELRNATGDGSLLHPKCNREPSPVASVIFSTSTRIRVPERFVTLTGGGADAVRAALEKHGAVCVGTPAEPGKLAAPALPFEALAGLADYVLVEADGSRGLPLKAHEPHEPVIPACAGQTILVVGADGFGRPIREVCHRPALYARLAGVSEADPVTPALAARVIAAERFGDRLFVNKTEDGAAMAAARALAALLRLPAAAGSLLRGEYECLC